MKRSRFSLLIFVLIFAGLLLLGYSLLSGSDAPQISYSEVCELFTDEKVESFVLEDGVLRLTLNQPDADGNKVVEHELADTETFRQDLGELIREQQRAGILKEYDYVPDAKIPWYLPTLLCVVLVVLAFFVFYFLMLRANNSGGGAPKFGKVNVRLGSGDKKVTFDDVAGAEEEKEELKEIVDFLRNPQKYRELGARVPRGVLLVGPPGTGKTLIAKAVAGEADVQFLSISGSDFVELYVGVGASRVRDLFEQAKKCAPSIVFIDEIDAVGRQRGAGLGGGNDEREQTLNQLLVEMDGFGSKDNVIVMAATNRQDILDPALLRPGRFDRQVYVSPPDMKGREEILHVHARNKRLAEDVDLKTIARATGGFTGADLANLLNEAALLSARRNCPFITMDAVESAIMKVIAGPEKKSRVRLEQELRLTAFHEAGHAVSMYYLPTQDPVREITIIPRGRALGMTISLPERDRSNWTRNEMREEIVALLGGRVAEQAVFNDISTGASNDLQKATAIARDMIARYGMSDSVGAVSYDSGDEIFVGRNYERTKSYSEQTAAVIDSEMKRVVDEAYRQCLAILTEHRDRLDAVAEYLLAHEKMSRRQFEACMRGESIPEAVESIFDESGDQPKAEQNNASSNGLSPEQTMPDSDQA